MSESRRDGERVVVLGAGLAGLTAALELARRGCDVTVLEAAPIAGGRTSSWRDAAGREVDTGLHVVADHYVNLIELLGDVGASRDLVWFQQHHYLRAGRDPLLWHFTRKAPPFHLLRPALEMPLSLGERVGLGRATLDLAAYTQAGLADLDHLTYDAWHRRYHNGARGFWHEIAEAASDAATFLSCEQASARAVLSWMKYMARNEHAGDIACFLGPLGDALVAPLVRALEAAGGRVQLSTAAVGFVLAGDRVCAVEVAPALGTGAFHAAHGRPVVGEGRTRIDCDRVVCALPVQALRAAASPEFVRAAGLTPAMGLGTTPAVSAIVWFDRPIRPIPPGAPLVTGAIMRDFLDLAMLNRGPATGGSAYQFVLCRAAELLGRSDADIVADIVSDLRAVWPGAARARPVDYAIERIEAAMFAAVPGAHALRPGTRTGLGNLYLAGDWTRHELNASMEGACLSGRRAAEAVLADLGRPASLVRAVPESSLTARLEARRRGGLRASA